MALTKNAHWMFDQGLWTLRDDLTVMVAKDFFTEDYPDGKGLLEYEGMPILTPEDPNLRPNSTYLSWHRKRKFLASI